MVSYTRVAKSIKTAANFIASSQSNDGLWRDFYTLAGSSSDWVTGFVSYAVGYSNELSENLPRALKALLSRQRPNGGWSYNKSVPTDCDSTAWVLMFLSTVPTWRPSATQRAVQYVKQHQDPSSGGFSTYVMQDRIDCFIGAPNQALVDGWLSVHPSVTSVVIQSLLVHGESVDSKLTQVVVKYLLQQRNAFGVWGSYWWKGYGYCTYHSLRALTMTRNLDEQTALGTIQFLLSQQRENGGWNDSSGAESEVFATSFVLLSLLLFLNERTLAAVEKGVCWLLDNQLYDGSWRTTPILQIPPPMIQDPSDVATWRINEKGTGVVIEDEKRLFTTASALWALSVFNSVTL